LGEDPACFICCFTSGRKRNEVGDGPPYVGNKDSDPGDLENDGYFLHIHTVTNLDTVESVLSRSADVP
jgi:hypothetical protein